MARHRLTGKPEELVYRVDGTTITIPNRPGARVPVYELFSEDDYQLAWITQGLGDSPVAVDIGAHVGCFTLAFAKLYPKGRVEAFEASPSTASYLERNIVTNGLSDRVTSNQVALAAEAGVFEFADNGAASGLNGVLHLGKAGSTTVKVPSIPMSDAFARAGGKVDIVKMDTEGAEYAMVLGSKPADWATVQRVVMEYHALPGHSWDELAAFFAEAGLNLVHRLKFSDGLGMAWLSRDEISEPA
jgi:FkbM family methyltransferase